MSGTRVLDSDMITAGLSDALLEIRLGSGVCSIRSMRFVKGSVLSNLPHLVCLLLLSVLARTWTDGGDIGEGDGGALRADRWGKSIITIALEKGLA
ncbi:MAG: hypothetical protein LQ340_000553 [Diploschistes diacapsis]|nr:MAG: hypothetical protein LQ340_000553 [Diploschistes diacapsis]